METAGSVAAPERYHIKVRPWGRDPLFSFLCNSATGPFALALLGAVLLALAPAAVSYSEGTFFDRYNNEQSLVTMLKDVGFWACFVAQPLIVMSVVRLYFRRLEPTMAEMANTENRESDHKSAKTFDHWALIAIPLLIASGGCGMLFAVFVRHPGTWLSQPDGRWAGVCVGPVAFVTFYLITACVFRLGVTYSVLAAFFRSCVVVRPLHPDGCGGLSPLRRLSYAMNLAIVGEGLVIFVSVCCNYRFHGYAPTSWLNMLLMLSYLAGSTVAFFFPMWAAHRPMKEAQDRCLADLRAKFVDISAEHMDHGCGRAVADAGLHEKLSRLRTLHDTAYTMPVFPLNRQLLSAFITSLLSPIVVALITAWIQGLIPVGNGP